MLRNYLNRPLDLSCPNDQLLGLSANLKIRIEITSGIVEFVQVELKL